MNIYEAAYFQREAKYFHREPRNVIRFVYIATGSFEKAVEIAKESAKEDEILGWVKIDRFDVLENPKWKS